MSDAVANKLVIKQLRSCESLLARKLVIKSCERSYIGDEKQRGRKRLPSNVRRKNLACILQFSTGKQFFVTTFSTTWRHVGLI